MLVTRQISFGRYRATPSYFLCCVLRDLCGRNLFVSVNSSEVLPNLYRPFRINASSSFPSPARVDWPTIAPCSVSLPSTMMPYSVPNIVFGNALNKRPNNRIVQVECLLILSSFYANSTIADHCSTLLAKHSLQFRSDGFGPDFVSLFARMRRVGHHLFRQETVLVEECGTDV